MTTAEFQKKFGPKFSKLSDDMLEAIRQTLLDQSPMSIAENRPLGDFAAGGAIVAAEEQGYRKAVKAFMALGTVSEQSPEPPSKYKEPEQI